MRITNLSVDIVFVIGNLKLLWRNNIEKECNECGRVVSPREEINYRHIGSGCLPGATSVETFTTVPPLSLEPD